VNYFFLKRLLRLHLLPGFSLSLAPENYSLITKSDHLKGGAAPASPQQQKERKMSCSLCWNPLLPFEIRPNRHVKRKLSTTLCTRLDKSQNTTADQRQLNLSVLRFTLGIPGLDESYLPRWIGYAFGPLLLLNHFAGSNSTTPTPAQLVSLLLSEETDRLTSLSIFLEFLSSSVEIRGSGSFFGWILYTTSLHRQISQGCDSSGSSDCP